MDSIRLAALSTELEPRATRPERDLSRFSHSRLCFATLAVVSARRGGPDGTIQEHTSTSRCITYSSQANNLETERRDESWGGKRKREARARHAGCR